MRRWHLILGFAAATAGGVGYAVSRHPRAAIVETQGDSASAADVPPALASSMEKARRSVLAAGEERRRAEEEAAAAPSPADGEEARGAANERTPSPGPETLTFRLAASFAKEAVDPAWSESARRAAEERIRRQLDDPTLLRSVDCRKTLCRVETETQEPARRIELIRRIVDEPGHAIWSGAFHSTFEPDPETAELVAVTYLLRQGEIVPRL